MKTFKQFVEHSKNNNPELRSTDEAVEALGDRLSKLRAVASFEEYDDHVEFGHLLMYEFKDAGQVSFFLKSKRLQKWVGHIVLTPTSTGHYEVIEVHFIPEVRSKGLGKALYLKIAGLGYHIQSNKVLSDASEKVWLWLGNKGLAKTLDLETGKTEPFNDKPMKDKNPLDIRYVWVLEQQDLGMDSIPMYEYWAKLGIEQEEIDRFERGEYILREWGRFVY